MNLEAKLKQEPIIIAKNITKLFPLREKRKKTPQGVNALLYTERVEFQ